MGQSWCYPQSFSQESEDCVGSVEEHGDQSFSAGTGELHQQPACIQKGLVSLCLSLTPATGGNIISLAVALASFLFMARPFQCYPLPSNDTTARIASSHTANKRKKTESSHCDGLCLAPASWQLTDASRAQCPHPLMGLQTLSK